LTKIVSFLFFIIFSSERRPASYHRHEEEWQ
jgi:hypothetical protein